MNTPARTMTMATAVAAGALLAMGCVSEPTTPRDQARDLAPLYSVSAPDEATDRYIVVFKRGTSNAPDLALDLVARFGGSIRYLYRHALQGFSASLTPQAVDVLRTHPAVEYVQQVELGKFRLHDHMTQPNATWGIDRIDQRSLPLSGTYVHSGTGSGVRVYIVDSGIFTNHGGFGGRASVFLDPRPEDGLNGQDCNGHGTHVAGTVGSTTYGVAKGVTLLAVRVNIACTDTVDSEAALAGIDSITGTSHRPAIANLSWGGRPDTALDQAINNSITAGVVYVVSAGNNGGDACHLSPARVPNAVTVAATDINDTRAVFNPLQSSNFGPCVDLFAPGRDITSLWLNDGTNTISGTSQAAPHVAGAAALFLESDALASPAEVWSALSGRTTTGALSGIGDGSPNRLLYSLLATTIGGPSTITTAGTYRWEAFPSDPLGSYAYQWSVFYLKSGVTQQLGTGKAQSLTVGASTGSFRLNVSVTKGTEHAGANLAVSNQIPGGCTLGCN